MGVKVKELKSEEEGLTPRKFRFPDGTTLMGVYTSESETTGKWIVSLRVGNARFDGELSGIHRLINKLGAEWWKANHGKKADADAVPASAHATAS